MSSPKPKKTPSSKSSSKAPLFTKKTEAEAEQTPVFLAAPDSLYAQVRGIDDQVVMHPVVALRYQNEKMVAFIPVNDEIVPVTEVERFEEFVWDFAEPDNDTSVLPDDDDPDTEDGDDDDENDDEEDDEDDDEEDDEDEDDDFEEADEEDDEK